MRALLQRVSKASVSIAGETVAQIDAGLLVLLGIFPEDGPAEIDYLVDKLLGLRIFPDDAKAMNRSVMDIDGEVLVVSQFTLAADTSRGRRPGFGSAAPPEIAQPLYEQFLSALATKWPRISGGVFGADMQVALINDGPVTILLDK